VIFLKGVELPVSTLVIVIIALAVLLSILAILYVVWNPGVSLVSLEAARSNACNLLVGAQCNIPLTSVITKNFDADKDGTVGSATDTLLALCTNYYDISDSTNCKRDICKCPEEWL